MIIAKFHENKFHENILNGYSLIADTIFILKELIMFILKLQRGIFPYEMNMQLSFLYYVHCLMILFYIFTILS